MRNKYYTYIHTYENKILYIGIGTYYTNRKTHKQKYERAYQTSNRGYYKQNIDNKRVKVHLFGNFDTKEEALQYETHLHNSKSQLIHNRDLEFKVLSRSQQEAYKSVSKKLNKQIRCITTGKEFDSVSEASKELNIHISRISENLRGKRKYCINLKTKEHLKFEYVVKN